MTANPHHGGTASTTKVYIKANPVRSGGAATCCDNEIDSPGRYVFRVFKTQPDFLDVTVMRLVPEMRKSIDHHVA